MDCDVHPVTPLLPHDFVEGKIDGLVFDHAGKRAVEVVVFERAAACRIAIIVFHPNVEDFHVQRRD